jgi:ABC-type oligopeptide transport system ATPase subunit
LLHTLACASQPTQGELIFNGQPVWQLSHSARHQLRRQLFLAPQTPPCLRVSVSSLRYWRAFAALVFAESHA